MGLQSHKIHRVRTRRLALGIPTAVHIFEPTGYAGIFQHSCQLAHDLNNTNDLKVVLHTSRQHELVDGVELCTCCWWPRRDAGNLLRTISKRIAILASLTLRTLPHLLRVWVRGSVLHLQGPGPSSAINLLVLWAARLRGYRVVYSPHDTFSRRGTMDDRLLKMTYRPAHAIMVFSQADKARLQLHQSRVYVSPLTQLVPQPSESQVLRWRFEWAADEPKAVVVLCAGFIRPDKRLDLLIESARSWPRGRYLAVVGEDRGHWEHCKRIADRHGVCIKSHIGFVELDEFAAAVVAADVVAVPAEQAAQSGVLSLASQLGTPTVAANVGGMAELASRTFRPGDVADLTAAIDAELENSTTNARPSSTALSIASHLRAYGIEK